MNIGKLLSVRTSDIHYILLFIISIILVAWQYFGMSLSRVVVPADLVAVQATVYSDSVNGGRSKTRLSNNAEEIRLDCSIILSDTFAFCGVMIPLVPAAEKGLDLRKYSDMQIELEYESLEKDTLLIYLINEDVLEDGSKLEKSNLWAVSPEAGINRFDLSPHRFIMPSWWIFQNRRNGLNLEPDISNVTAIRITTGDNTLARETAISIRHIAFSGKYISADDLYLYLLFAWLGLLALHGLGNMHALTKRYQQSAQHNKKLLELNQFLRIQKNEFETMAKKDKLTGAWNRAGVRDVLESSLEEYKVKNIPCTLLSIDIDHFKKINDDFGHDIGDQALKVLTALIDKHTRDDDYLARWGGEEFILICPNTNMHAAQVLAATLKYKIETTDLIDQRRITCSFGIAELANEEIKDWFKRADEALYRAKAAGRNAIESATT